MSKKLNQQQKDLVTEAFYRKRSGESYISIASSFGIDRRTLFGYRNSIQGQQIEKELRQNLIEQAYESILEVVMDKAHLGSVQHAKLYFQVTGKLKPDGVEVKQELNVTKETTPDLLADIDKILAEE